MTSHNPPKDQNTREQHVSTDMTSHNPPKNQNTREQHISTDMIREQHGYDITQSS